MPSISGWQPALNALLLVLSLMAGQTRQLPASLAPAALAMLTLHAGMLQRVHLMQ